MVLVRTKGDLGAEAVGVSRMGVRRGFRGYPGPGRIESDELAGRVRVSVETGDGLDQLRMLLPDLVYRRIVTAAPETPVITRDRQARALGMARGEIDAFRDGLLSGLPAEIAGTHLRTAESALEELLGTISTDDVLDVVFREFCIGK